MLPETWAQIAVLLASVIPGFVYQVSRRRVGGPDPDEIELGTRILRAIAVSALFAGLYALLFGPHIVRYLVEPSTVVDDVRAVAASFLVFVVAVPWLSARIAFFVTTSPWYGRAAAAVAGALRLRRPWDPMPSAWDFAFSNVRPGWVRILTSDGTWLGGWFAERSFASSFPHPQEIFIEVGYLLDADGRFTDQETAPGGVFVRCGDIVSVDFIPAEVNDREQEVLDARQPDQPSAAPDP